MVKAEPPCALLNFIFIFIRLGILYF
ncbi:hypothetical protein R2601_00925 [Salipiger bermudensis HTCC2601]|uniref:Uncharacterized protein n=1 Tax=Salipiger bermudensis (strain DSM 26914 / JCM 13377 / KCTC 12554 / HTCC2601) TaxID=314265 RepID=Q0FUX3_SALBH|nr:hypothetical protein R2601_00925 [Salipiger bermudensis HTCC2601]